jgi:hypothetical protein
MTVDLDPAAFEQVVRTASLGSPLPYFSLRLRGRMNVTNPNYVPIVLEDVRLEATYEGTPFISLAGKEGETVWLKPGSPKEPGVTHLIVHLALDTGDGDIVSLTPAMRCARDIYGGKGSCRVMATVSAQPKYLGIGKGVIPRQTFTLPVDIRKGFAG